jgi:hypothetical protein
MAAGGVVVDEGTCCGGSCVDTSTDSSNCQGCGNVCPAGAFCETQDGGGGCFQTMPGTACPTSCGPFAVCAGNQCVFTTACNQQGETACAAEDGTVGYCCGAACAHPLDDPQNCGGCGVVCAAGQQCVAGQCG